MNLKEKFEKLVYEKIKIKKTAVSLLLLFSLTEAKADFSTNLIINPVYSFFPGNIYHSLIWNDEEINRNPKLKKTINASRNILSKYIKDKRKLKKLNIEYLQLISKLYDEKKTIDALDFLDNFLSIWGENNLTISQSIDILKDYIKIWFIPQSYFRLFRKEIWFKLKWLINFYWEEKFYTKIKEVEKLYKDNELTKEKIKEIFKEYIKNKEDVSIILDCLALIFFWWMLWVTILTFLESNKYDYI